jgi:signal peptidase I
MPDFLVDFADFNALATSILNEGHHMRFMARGESMRPFIQDGDIVEVQPIELEKLERGDVVLCKLNDDRLVVHRVIQVAPDDVLIQGDALPYPDGRFPYSQVLGRVEMIFRQKKPIQMNMLWMKFLVNVWLVLASIRSVLLRVIHRLDRELHMKKIIKRSDESLYH